MVVVSLKAAGSGHAEARKETLERENFSKDLMAQHHVLLKEIDGVASR